MAPALGGRDGAPTLGGTHDPDQDSMTSKTTTFSLLFLFATSAATLATASCGDSDPAVMGTGGAGATTGPGGSGGGGGNGDCTTDAECGPSEVCEQSTCLDAACVNGVQDGNESDVDCGANCLPCTNGETCNAASDCASGFCDDGSGTGGGDAGGGDAGGSDAGGNDAGGSAPSDDAVCAPCASDGDCAGSDGTYCDGGACVPQKDLGESCDAHTQCDSGFCPEDGVCCDANCNGSCEACTEAATGEADGTCAPVMLGLDPDGECAADDPASCGASGDGCNGDAADPGCILYDAQTSCGGAACTDGEASEESFCDGSGTCSAGSTTSCGAYACDDAGVACETTCADGSDCASTHYCSNGTCVAKKGNGDGCTAADQCQSGFCPGDDGICCDAACEGTCMACLASKTGGQNGVCSFVSSNTDPDNECGALTSCNGAGACTL